MQRDIMVPGVLHAESLSRRVFRFIRALVVGSGATLVDYSIFSICIRLVGVAPTVARLPALCAGACVQFFGNRSYTFRAQSGNLSRQAKWFVGAELCALALNWSLFRLLTATTRGVAPEIISFAGTFIVFVAFAYPMRRLVIFKIPGQSKN